MPRTLYGRLVFQPCLKRAFPTVGLGAEGCFVGASVLGSVCGVPTPVDGLGRKERREFDRRFP